MWRAIIGHSGRTIEVVRIEGGSYTRSHDIRLLLTLAPRLKEVSIWSKTKAAFGCRNGNIPRPEINRCIFGGPPDDYVLIENIPHESVNLQRQVYDALERFTKLRES